MPPRERVPPSVRVETELRERLAEDEWAAGEALPSVAALAAYYGVSRSSVAKALRRLADDGLVEIVANWGTFRVGGAPSR